jgi:hypothetical protein
MARDEKQQQAHTHCKDVLPSMELLPTACTPDSPRPWVSRNQPLSSSDLEEEGPVERGRKKRLILACVCILVSLAEALWVLGCVVGECCSVGPRSPAAKSAPRQNSISADLRGVSAASDPRHARHFGGMNSISYACHEAIMGCRGCWELL